MNKGNTGRGCWSLLVALGAALIASPLQAHPHGWVDLSVRLEVDDRQRLTALRQAWRMDPFYSLVLLEEIAASDQGMEAALDRLGSEIAETLAPQGFFTEASRDEEPLSFAHVTDTSVLNRDGRIVLHLRLPLAEPVPLDNARLTYRVFDPSYYIEVVHEADDDGVPLANALVVPDGLDCVHRILAPDPDPAQIQAAAELDRDDRAAPGLGRFFAETGVVEC
ncbi:DUF1007 family protein [Halomonas sp. V046]|uniref:DUF1007 family protein n=1 Tax=Halomonas sp. V046 TaxID=3459611 RepID=UPI004043BE21